MDRTATPDDVRAAFRRLAMRYHPDRNPDDPVAVETFREVNAAHQILSDVDKRAAWDRFGAAAFRAGGAGAATSLVDLDFDALVSDLWGAVGFRRGDARGDVEISLSLPFSAAARGGEHQVTIRRQEQCGTCEGAGAEPGSARHVCPRCQGRGRLLVRQGLFPVRVERTCGRCAGTGWVFDASCRECRGAGLVARERVVTVTVRPGVEDGERVAVPGAGSRPRPQEPPGKLNVRVEVQPHEFFRRAGDDVRCELPISFTQAALGASVDVPTVDGSGVLKIPPGTQPGATLRIRGKGIAHRHRPGRGDQLVEVKVEVPRKLSDRARRALVELDALMEDDARQRQRGLLERLSGWFGRGR